MKKWRETQAVLRALERPQRAALATVVRVQGSVYRREGARLLVCEDGRTVGNVSGGCLEQDVKESALQVIASQEPRLRKYCSGADDIGAWDMGLGCDGQVEILIEPAAGDWEPVRSLLAGDDAFAVCMAMPVEAEAWQPRRLAVVGNGDHTGSLGDRDLDAAVLPVASKALGRRASGLHDIAGRAIFIDLFEPPPRLLIVGAGDDAPPLARLAAGAGFNVLVVDRRPGLLRRERFPEPVLLVESEPQALARCVPLDPRSFAVVMTHIFASDREYLEALLPAPVPFIGLLGPRQRAARLLDALSIRDATQLERIHAPVGLDLGGEGAEQIALAIVGEVLATMAGRSAAPLRERTRPIHDATG